MVRLSKFLAGGIALCGFILAGVITPAQAAVVGGIDDGFVGCDIPGLCSITLDEQGHIISGITINQFGGPIDITLTNIAPTSNPAYAGLEVTSYSVVGRSSTFGAPFRLIGGALGICDFGVTVDGSACTGPGGNVKGDVLVFTPGIIDDAGFGHSTIDFLSDAGSGFAFATDFNVLEVGPENANSAFYMTDGTGVGGANEERLSYIIISDSGSEVPEPASLALLGSALAGLGLIRRRRRTVA